MARKASDMIMLLSSRGKAKRGKSGFHKGGGGVFAGVTQWFGQVFGGARRAYDGKGARGVRNVVPSWLALGVALACFAGGYLVGGKYGAHASDGADLNARQDGRRPGVIGEVDVRPLSTEAFLVSAYPDPDDAVALDKAKALSEFLQGKGLLKTQPYQYEGPKGKVWTVAVYFDGEADGVATRNKLIALTDVPDAAFQQLRQERAGTENAPGDWPIRMPIR